MSIMRIPGMWRQRQGRNTALAASVAGLTLALAACTDSGRAPAAAQSQPIETLCGGQSAPLAPPLDAGFGAGGSVIADFGGRFDTANAVATAPDGRIIVAGSVGIMGAERTAYDMAVARYLPDGSPDGSFGRAGVVTTDFFGGEDAAYAVALQPDGRILVAGSAARDGGAVVALARYLADGGLDPSFGKDGTLTLPPSAPAADQGRSGDARDRATALALQPDGRIIVAGAAVAPGFSSPPSAGLLLRLNADGRMDTTFGTGGAARVSPVKGVVSVALRPDGRILVLGDGLDSGDVVVARHTSDGVLDGAFGVSGAATIDLGSGADSAAGLTVAADGSVVVVGTTRTGTITSGDIVRSNGPRREGLVVARLGPDGALDPSFGAAGIRSVPFAECNARAGAVALLADGGMIVAGSVSTPHGDDLALVRLDAQGAPDTGFAANGSLLIDAGGEERAGALAVQADGGMVAAGSSGVPYGPTRVLLVRAR